MDAVMPAIWWLDRRWRSFVSLVAALDRGAHAAARSTIVKPAAASGFELRRTNGRSTAPSRRETDVAPGIVRVAVGREDARDAAATARHRDPSPVQPNPQPQAGRIPAWLLEARPEPPGAVALAAHLDARRAQAAGLRALLFARQRRYAEAEEAFAQAATLDPALDLTGLDGFWELGRGAHEAAVRAYEGAGRSRDAVLLRATLDGRYRPRLVRTA